MALVLSALMPLEICYFETERMTVGAWSHLLDSEATQTRRDAFIAMPMTDAVRCHLPSEWQGPYNADRVVLSQMAGSRWSACP